MRQVNSFHIKKIQSNTLTYVMTIVYKLLFNTVNGTIVQYNAVVWKKESSKDHWHRQSAVKWATENLEKFPLCIPFGMIPADHFPHYYQFRRLERYIVEQIYTFGLTWHMRSKAVEFPPHDIFNPELTDHEQMLQEQYEASLPMFGYRRRRFNKLEKRGIYSTIVKPFIDQFAFTLGYIPEHLEFPPIPTFEPVMTMPAFQQTVSDQSIIQPAEPIPDQSIVHPTEPVSDQSIVQPTEPISDQLIVQPVEPISDQPIVQPTEPVSDQPIVQPTEPVSDQEVVQPTEPISDQPTEPISDQTVVQPTEPVPDQSVQPTETIQSKKRRWYWLW